MSRRKFMATTGGMAATFLAMNDVFGRYFNVSRDALSSPRRSRRIAHPRTRSSSTTSST